MAQSATPNLADYVNTLPAISGSSTPQATTINVGQGQEGIDANNLHGFGTVGTLTLLDGRRVGVAINTDVADVSELPQQLFDLAISCPSQVSSDPRRDGGATLRTSKDFFVRISAQNLAFRQSFFEDKTLIYMPKCEIRGGIFEPVARIADKGSI
jgi:hypothetical protein